MATKKDNTLLIALVALGALGIGIGVYAYRKKKKESETSVEGAGETSVEAAVESAPQVIYRDSGGAKPPKYKESSGVLEAGSYGRKIAIAQMAINRVSGPNTVTVDGQLGSKTIAEFGKVQDRIKKLIGARPKFNTKTIDGLEVILASKFGVANFKNELAKSPEYQKVTQKYTA